MRAVLRGVRRCHLFSNTKTTSRGSYAIVAMQFGLLLWTIVIVYLIWDCALELNVLYAGYVATLFGALVGFGVTTLVSTAAAQGCDEPAKLVRLDTRDRTPERGSLLASARRRVVHPPRSIRSPRQALASEEPADG
jgi:hypothetical protein